MTAQRLGLEGVEIVIQASHSHLGVNYKAVARNLGSYQVTGVAVSSGGGQSRLDHGGEIATRR